MSQKERRKGAVHFFDITLQRVIDDIYRHIVFSTIKAIKERIQHNLAGV